MLAVAVENSDQVVLALIAVVATSVAALVFTIRNGANSKVAAEQSRQANAAVNNRPSGEPTIASNVMHLVAEVDRLAKIQDEFSARGWAALPDSLATAPALTQTIHELQRLAEQASVERSEIKAKLYEHDDWERSVKHHDDDDVQPVRMDLTRYSKLIVALLGAIALALGDGFFDMADGVNVIIALVTAAGVYFATNTQPTEGA